MVKIIDVIKTKAKPSKKEITKEEAEKILKEHQKQDHDHDHPKEKKAAKTAKPKETRSKKVSKK